LAEDELCRNTFAFCKEGHYAIFDGVLLIEIDLDVDVAAHHS